MRRKEIVPCIGFLIYAFLSCAIAASAFAYIDATLCRAPSSETAGGVILGDKLGLLVSHLFHCLHIIPLECISLCHLVKAGITPTRSHRHL